MLALTLSLETGYPCFSAGYLKLVDLCTSEESLVSSSQLPMGRLGFHNCLSRMPGFSVESGDSNSCSHTCTEVTFTH